MEKFKNELDKMQTGSHLFPEEEKYIQYVAKLIGYFKNENPDSRKKGILKKLYRYLTECLKVEKIQLGENMLYYEYFISGRMKWDTANQSDYVDVTDLQRDTLIFFSEEWWSGIEQAYIQEDFLGDGEEILEYLAECLKAFHEEREPWFKVSLNVDDTTDVGITKYYEWHWRIGGLPYQFSGCLQDIEYPLREAMAQYGRGEKEWDEFMNVFLIVQIASFFGPLAGYIWGIKNLRGYDMISRFKYHEETEKMDLAAIIFEASMSKKILSSNLLLWEYDRIMQEGISFLQKGGMNITVTARPGWGREMGDDRSPLISPGLKIFLNNFPILKVKPHIRRREESGEDTIELIYDHQRIFVEFLDSFCHDDTIKKRYQHLKINENKKGETCIVRSDHSFHMIYGNFELLEEMSKERKNFEVNDIFSAYYYNLFVHFDSAAELFWQAMEHNKRGKYGRRPVPELNEQIEDSIQRIAVSIQELQKTIGVRTGSVLRACFSYLEEAEMSFEDKAVLIADVLERVCLKDFIEQLQQEFHKTFIKVQLRRYNTKYREHKREEKCEEEVILNNLLTIDYFSEAINIYDEVNRRRIVNDWKEDEINFLHKLIITKNEDFLRDRIKDMKKTDIYDKNSEIIESIRRIFKNEEDYGEKRRHRDKASLLYKMIQGSFINANWMSDKERISDST